MNRATIICALMLIRAMMVLAQSSSGDVVGKLSVGYQGWFACQGDNSSINIWSHWAGNTRPSPGHQTFELWPDVREYSKTYQTGYANLGNSNPAKLFSSYDDQTIAVHLQWIAQNGIDTVAVQRFGVALTDPRWAGQFNSIATKIRLNAERLNRKFYIMWDVSGWNNFSTELMNDWRNTVINFTISPAYARQNGRPVVCIWGFGFLDRPGTQAQALSVINFLKNNGLYVIGGVPRNWRLGLFSKPGFLPVYSAFNMLSPWSVGSFGGIAGALSYQVDLRADLLLCNALNIDYQPVLFPGFAWSNWNGGARNVIARLHGDFMWQQFVNLRQIGIRNSYVAMFDEYDEATAIAKAAENASMIPTNQYFLTLDADGVRCSSDFYLRLVNDGNKMMKGITPLQSTHPTSHT